MKIVYCVPNYYAPYGGLRILTEHANRLQERGHQVEIWSLDQNIKADIFPNKVKTLYVPSDGDLKRQKVKRLFPAQVGAMEPDIFVAGAFPIVPAIGSVPKAKHFWYLQHDESFACNNNEELATLQECLAMPVTLLTNSRWTQEAIKNKYHRESIIVPYGIDHELFRPSEKPLIKKVFPSIVFVWFDAEWKGSIDIPFAAIIVDKEFAKSRLIAIAVSMPQKFIGYEDMVLCIQPRQEILKDIYSSADVFVSSSWYEGFGLPGLEAMACGVPVVTTDSGGVREYAIHDETAIMVSPKHPEALAEAIIRVLKDEKLRKKLIRNGLEKAKEFDWEKSMDLLEKIFSD